MPFFILNISIASIWIFLWWPKGISEIYLGRWLVATISPKEIFLFTFYTMFPCFSKHDECRFGWYRTFPIFCHIWLKLLCAQIAIALSQSTWNTPWWIETNTSLYWSSSYEEVLSLYNSWRHFSCTFLPLLLLKLLWIIHNTQLTCSKPTTETLEKGVKYVRS